MSFKIKLLAHASFKLAVNNKIIYIDPYGGNPASYDQKADLILITHKHRDHSDPEKIALIQRENSIILTPKDNAGTLKGKVIAFDPKQRYEFNDITIHGLYGYNFKRFRNPGEPFHPKEIQTAYLIEANNKRAYFAGDTDFIEEMKALKNIDIAFLPIGDKYTMDANEAVEATLAFNPKKVVPIHWRDQNPEQFKTLLATKTNKSTPILLKEGDEINI